VLLNIDLQAISLFFWGITTKQKASRFAVAPDGPNTQPELSAAG
jgi:hypothetical protein